MVGGNKGKAGSGGKNRNKGPASDANRHDEAGLELAVEKCRRETGPGFVGAMCEEIITDYKKAILQLTDNANDADADNFRIVYSGIEDRLGVEDDGEGCDAEGMKTFYMISGSPKRRGKLTKKGRIPIGYKGWGTLALPRLCRHYDLTTWKKGVMRKSSEDFPDELEEIDQSRDIDIVPSKCDKEKHGMKIVMKGLRMRGDEFSVKDLVKYLRKNIRVRHDFHIFVNDEEIKHLNIENATEYVFKIDTAHVGVVSGSIYVSRMPLKQEDRGITVRVNYGTIGDQDHFNLGSYGLGLASRLNGFVDANGLRGHTNFEKTRFDTKSLAFVEFEEAVTNVLLSIRKDYDNESKLKEKQKITDNIRKKIENIISGCKRQYSKLGIMQLKFSDEANAGKVASIKKGLVHINRDFIRVSSIRDPSFVGQLETAITFALTVKKIEEEYAGKSTRKHMMDKISEFEEAFTSTHYRMYPQKKSLTDILNEPKSEAILYLNEYRLYSPEEIQAKTQVSYMILRRLEENGILKEAVVEGETRSDRVFAKDVKDSLKFIEGHSILYEIIKEMYSGSDENSCTGAEKTLKRQLEHAQNKGELPNYVVDLGKPGAPFYIVRKDMVEDFIKRIQSGEFRIRKSENAPETGAAGDLTEEKIREYDKNEVYREGESVYHPQHGVGKVVLSSLYEGKCEILFGDHRGKFLMGKDKEDKSGLHFKR